MTDVPLIQAARLWAKTSANGRCYLTGRLGGLRVLVFENARRGEFQIKGAFLPAPGERPR